MQYTFIPKPQKIEFKHDYFIIPAKGVIGIANQLLYPVALKLKSAYKKWPVNISAGSLPDTISLRVGQNLKPGGYRLDITGKQAILEGASIAAVFHGLQTLFQIIDQSPAGKLPCLKIDDWPDIPDRGFYFDVSRGRMPKLEQIKQMVDILAHYKINQFQLYIEHTFAFRGHPDIGRDASPLTADDILELDAYCRERFIELVPSLASFGHMATVLHNPQYHRLAEDWGIGRYITPDRNKQAWLKHWLDTFLMYDNKTPQYGFTLSPANPDIYKFLDSLYSEFLPLFSSGRFNACCDETVDLGDGQSYHLCRRLGLGRVFLNHVLRLNDLSHKYGKKLMVWGDIIRHYPELIPEIPKDVTVLDWAYEDNHKFETIRDFTKARVPVYACPGAFDFGSWHCNNNISGFAAAAFKYGARGLLNTNWCYNFTEYVWPGIVFGAEQGWNTASDQKSFISRFFRHFVKSNDPLLTDAVARLNKYGGMPELYFARPGKPLLPAEGKLTAKLGRDKLKELDPIRVVFKKHATLKGEDPLRILPYWIYAIDTRRHTARKLAAYGCGGKVTPGIQSDLRKEFASLKARFTKLWMERYQPAGLKIGLDNYRKARKAVISFDWSKAYTGFVSKLLVSRPVTGAGNLKNLAYPVNKQILGFVVRKFPETFCDLHNDVFACGNRDIAVYFSGILQVPESMKLSVGVGYDGPVKVWIDGKMKFHDPAGGNPGAPDKAIIPLNATPGRHEILIALSSNHGKAWGLFLRFIRHDIPWRQVQKGPTAYRLPTMTVS